MFIKLSQHSTAWWVCVAITCVFSASLLTILIYPVYADEPPPLCRRDICGAPRGCGPCNAEQDGLGDKGFYALASTAGAYTYWTEGSGDDIQCWGRANTYHRANVYNMSGEERKVQLTYTALFREPGGGDQGCTPQHPITKTNTPPQSVGDFWVDDGVHFKNTYTQSQSFVLGVPGSGCDYEVQSLSELYFYSTGNTADTQDPGPRFVGCP